MIWTAVIIFSLIIALWLTKGYAIELEKQNRQLAEILEADKAVTNQTTQPKASCASCKCEK